MQTCLPLEPAAVTIAANHSGTTGTFGVSWESAGFSIQNQNQEDKIMAGKEQHSEKMSKKAPQMNLKEKRAAKKAKKIGAPIGQGQTAGM
jgi:hypothetical protein